jgi:RNA polymerase sigma-70 factor (ECF subfamily)
MNSADPFETIVREHYEALFRFALGLTRSESDARDLTQQTYYVWAMKGHQLRDCSKVKTWLFTTLHRLFLVAQRKQNRFPHHDLEAVAEQLSQVLPKLVDQADCSQVLSALTQVDEVYQAAVALFYLEDCSYRDIAAILEVPVGTVKSRIARGIAQLKKILFSGDRPSVGLTGNTSSPEPDYDHWNFGSSILRNHSVPCAS